MLGAAGIVAPELLGKLGLIPAETGLVWFRSGVIPPAGTYDYWADPYVLFVLEVVLVAFAEHRRGQDYYSMQSETTSKVSFFLFSEHFFSISEPGYGSKTPLLGLEKVLGGSGEPAYPGGPFFNILGLGKDEAALKVLKTKEIKNGRLAMLACLGFFIQAMVTGEGPVENLFSHLSNPVASNILTNLKIH